MLKTRVLTAVFILVAFLPALFFLTPSQWALLVALIVGVAAWEWGRFMGLERQGQFCYGIFLGLLCAIFPILVPILIEGESPALHAAPLALLIHGVAVFFWALIVPAWLRWKWQLQSAFLGGLVGCLVIIPAWLALVQLRLLSPMGLLAVLAGVWIADVGAYFTGKRFGRHKLAPSISPGKTWEGALGAGVGVLSYGLVLRHFFQFSSLSLGLCLLALALITAISILGDLFESLLKRQAGLKDSSQILPGHGGVLDRIDSLTSTLPVVTLLWLFIASNF